ncbi:mechanosensitive ion channel family protein [Salarchaeum japonicum]|uniref:Mechanosensitive ion channel family protein n=1 Tax=Salarchaeum japonicum TaxID=555573 RepID=A0AAV3T1G5_9EURY|nr:mechanosensitive ion channel family protein [Salarchaeum japonicum]
MSALADLTDAVQSLGPAERAVLSVAVLVLLALGWRASRRFAASARENRSDRIVDVLLVVLVLAFGALGVEAFLVLWGAHPLAVDAVQAVTDRAELGVRLVLTAVLLAGAYVFTEFLHGRVDDFVADRENITDHQAEITFRLLQITLYVGALITALGIWNVNLSGLLIGAGFAGIVFGMAARQTLGAVIAGFVLMFARPFEIGDWVKIGSNDGIVTDITIVNTRIQTFDGEYVMLPNDYVGSEEVVNRSRKGRLRLHVEVGVDYTTDVEHAIEVAEETLKDVEDVLTVPQPQVVLTEFGDSAVVLDLRFWIDKPSARRKWRAQTAVISQVHEAFREAGITIPFPQRELSARDDGMGVRIPDDYGPSGDDGE